ncbi:MAG: methyl-accepting chemotaxis protein [Alphaproteobacteria bacterium]|nr:methyl-accepting chemotaxis protein [Alphaproteobacteria bacterium]
MKIKLKLPAFIIACTLISALAIGFEALISSKQTIQHSIDKRANALLLEKKIALTALFHSIEEDVKFIAKDRNTLSAFDGFYSAWVSEKLTTESLQDTYIHKNSNPTGKKHLLNEGLDGSKYSELHNEFHPWFRRYLEKGEYYDIFLIDLNGNIIYTVFKELDFATNLKNGAWKDTDLGAVFRQAAESSSIDGQIFLVDFKSYGPSANAAASFISTPIFKDGKKIGVVAFQMPVDKINGLMGNREALEAFEESYIIGEDGLNRSSVDYGKDQKILSTKLENVIPKLGAKGESGAIETKNYKNTGVRSSYMPFVFNDLKWTLIFEEEYEEAFSDYTALKMQIILYALLSTLVVAIVGYLGALRLIIKPMDAIRQNLSDLGNNDTNVIIYGLDRKDEFLEFAKAAEIFKDNIHKNKKMQVEQKQLEEKANTERKKIMIELADNFEQRMQHVVSGLAAASTELAQTAENMNVLSSNSNDTVMTANQSALNITHHVDAVSSASQELYSSVQEISSQIHKSNELISESVNKVDDADLHATKLSASSQKVREVIQLIADISSQVNLLALNATIEAARAGESGKGFAVVASEVKNLANQTNKSVEEIGKVIDEMGGVSTDIVQSLSDIKLSVKKISESSVSIASAVEEQTVATNGIAQSVKEASQGTRMVSSGFEMVQQSAIEVNTSSQQMLDAARDLSRQAEELKSEVSKFIFEIRNS